MRWTKNQGKNLPWAGGREQTLTADCSTGAMLLFVNGTRTSSTTSQASCSCSWPDGETYQDTRPRGPTQTCRRTRSAPTSGARQQAATKRRSGRAGFCRNNLQGQHPAQLNCNLEPDAASQAHTTHKRTCNQRSKASRRPRCNISREPFPSSHTIRKSNLGTTLMSTCKAKSSPKQARAPDPAMAGKAACGQRSAMTEAPNYA